MPSRKKIDLHPILVEAYEKALIIYEEKYPNEPVPFLTCTYRSNEEQDQLFTQIPKVTQARAGQSPHNYLPSLAFDLAFLTIDKKLDWSGTNFRHFADIITLVDERVEWGGLFKSFVDKPHYQLKKWKGYLGG
jgi:peptidoglycan L-alanyl-D-glutamate endopeptidase CwlK